MVSSTSELAYDNQWIWNTRSMTFERFKYCMGLNFDVLALTELWRTQAKYQKRNKSFIVSAPKLIQKGPKKGQIRFPDDKATGVGIMLSSAARQKIKSFGSEGERVCWVRLAGPTCSLFVIAVCRICRIEVESRQAKMTHWGISSEKVLTSVPTGDCVCILGDLNEQLPSNSQGRTAYWCIYWWASVCECA